MKACHFLLAFSIVSTTAAAQQVQPQEPARMPPPAMGSQTDTATPGSSGQLITPAIVRSRPAGEAASAAPDPQTMDGITYLCGGVGEDEAAYMKQAAMRDYDLMMTFAERSGNYMANVDVTIRDNRGNIVLETVCDAPMLLVDLPPGSYRLRAEADGRALERSARVANSKGRARQATFIWSGAPAGSGSSGSN